MVLMFLGVDSIFGLRVDLCVFLKSLLGQQVSDSCV